jgi:hypothetical protein
MTVGILTWAYTLLLPSLADAGIVGRSLLATGRGAWRCCGRRRSSDSICRRSPTV